jgi:hypothetical protein
VLQDAVVNSVIRCKKEEEINLKSIKPRGVQSLSDLHLSFFAFSVRCQLCNALFKRITARKDAVLPCSTRLHRVCEVDVPAAGPARARLLGAAAGGGESLNATKGWRAHGTCCWQNSKAEDWAACISAASIFIS